MKINVNYELMSKIGEAKKGFNVHRVSKKIGTIMGFMSLVAYIISPNDIREIIESITYSFTLCSAQSISLELAGSFSNREKAQEELRILASRLNAIDVHTDLELLLEAEKYKTQYKIAFSDGIVPKVMQNKYIMVPTCNDEEVSLLQEHVICTRDYVLSVGEPQKQKQYRLAYNSG